MISVKGQCVVTKLRLEPCRQGRWVEDWWTECLVIRIQLDVFATSIGVHKLYSILYSSTNKYTIQCCINKRLPYRAYMYCTRQNPKLRVKFATLLPLREVLPLYPVILLYCLVTLDSFLGFPLYKMLISTLSPTFQLSIEIYHKWYLNYCKAPHLGLGSNRLGRFKS